MLSLNLSHFSKAGMEKSKPDTGILSLRLTQNF